MRTFALFIVLGFLLVGAVRVSAQQQGRMGGGSGMMGGGMMGTNPSSSQEGVGGAASNYSTLCASCHGAMGKGNGPAAVALNPKPKDFANCKVMAKISDEKLTGAIKGGGQSVGLSTMMPAWGGSLTDQQINELVSYIRGFCKK